MNVARIYCKHCFYNQIRNPIVVPIDTKPPQLDLYNDVRHARGSQDERPQLMLMGFTPIMESVSQRVHGPVANSPSNIVFPDAGDWTRYCDTIPKRRRAELGALGG